MTFHPETFYGATKARPGGNKESTLCTIEVLTIGNTSTVLCANTTNTLWVVYRRKWMDTHPYKSTALSSPGKLLQVEAITNQPDPELAAAAAEADYGPWQPSTCPRLQLIAKHATGFPRARADFSYDPALLQRLLKAVDDDTITMSLAVKGLFIWNGTRTLPMLFRDEHDWAAIIGAKSLA